MLAYLDSITAGLVPCKVTRIDGGAVTVRVTADRGCYRRGDTVETTRRTAVPRERVRRFRGRYFPVILPYRWPVSYGTA